MSLQKMPQDAANLGIHARWPSRLAGLRLGQALIKRFAAASWPSQRSSLRQSKPLAELHLYVSNIRDGTASKDVFGRQTNEVRSRQRVLYAQAGWRPLCSGRLSEHRGRKGTLLTKVSLASWTGWRQGLTICVATVSS